MLGDKIVKQLGGKVIPFQRFNEIYKKNKQVGRGECDSFNNNVILIDHIEKIPKQNRISENINEFNSDNKDAIKKNRYLWIIDEDGFKIIFEQTKNLNSDREIVCHTNITEGKEAIQGGELWIVSDSKLFINNMSGRYDHTSDEAFQEAINFIKKIGFDVVDITSVCDFFRKADDKNKLSEQDIYEINTTIKYLLDYPEDVTKIKKQLENKLTTKFEIVKSLYYLLPKVKDVDVKAQIKVELLMDILEIK